MIDIVTAQVLNSFEQPKEDEETISRVLN